MELVQLSRLVDMEDPHAVLNEVENIVSTLYTDFDFEMLNHVFTDIVQLFGGEYPGYSRCQTQYHDLKHTTDTFLAMARLIHGTILKGENLTRDQVMLGLLCALMHDTGYIRSLDEKSGASLKLTVLNPDGRIWLMVAGGGASVIYTDTVVDLGMMGELANYGEYSGDPSTDLTREYARTILDLMTRSIDPQGKVLLIGGGIANFTDVAKTFTGIIRALEEYREKLIENNVKIYVRRGGPNYKEGLEKMRKLGDRLGVPIEVYGPETHMTKIVSSAKEALAL